MAIYDHDAVRKAYPNAVSIGDDRGVFDIDGKEITIDNSLVESARVELNKLNYQKSRTGRDGSTDTIYPSIGDQLDALYKDIVAGTVTTSGAFATAIKATKEKYPKPS